MTPHRPGAPARIARANPDDAISPSAFDTASAKITVKISQCVGRRPNRTSHHPCNAATTALSSGKTSNVLVLLGGGASTESSKRDGRRAGRG